MEIKSHAVKLITFPPTALIKFLLYFDTKCGTVTESRVSVTLIKNAHNDTKEIIFPLSLPRLPYPVLISHGAQLGNKSMKGEGESLTWDQGEHGDMKTHTVSPDLSGAQAAQGVCGVRFTRDRPTVMKLV